MVHLDHADIRSLLKLMRELHEVGPLASTKKRHLLRAMAGMTASKGAVLLEGRVDPSERRLAPTSVIYEGWAKPAELRTLADYYQTQHPLDPLDPATAAAILDGGEFQTFVRSDLVVDAEWYDSAYLDQVRKPLGVDDVVLAINRLTPEYHYAIISLHRAPETVRFTMRERTLLDLAHSHTAWMYPAQDEAGKLTLAPRLQNTLQHLLGGMSEKEIAAQSGLTRNTVHEYVKHIYQYFGVSSRAELMSKVLRGGRQFDSER